MSNFIFLCGSSSVGKTELMGNFPEDIERVRMSFRDIREQLGNPEWETLRQSQIGISQQEAGIKIYEQRIYELSQVENEKSWRDRAVEKTYIFERSPFDISGYSFSFKLSQEHIQEMLNRAVAIFENLEEYGHKVLVIFRPVMPNFEYDRQNNARPPEDIRNSCNEFLMDFVYNRAYVMWKDYVNLNVILSMYADDTPDVFLRAL